MDRPSNHQLVQIAKFGAFLFIRFRAAPSSSSSSLHSFPFPTEREISSSYCILLQTARMLGLEKHMTGLVTFHVWNTLICKLQVETKINLIE